MTTQSNLLLVWLAFAAVGLGLLGSTRAPWKSRTLSPDSIERRFYWIGCAAGCILLLLSQLPNWSRGLFGAVACGLALVAIAFLRSNHLKVGGKIYAAFDFLRRPDRPPALESEDEQWRG
ncbi:hypothetical protein ORI20_31425 [Mycobacterium sp. CVI_P3]|uniref:Uncharacterized protein n=1 Tax=Mycobacterium pinniadriaticum TaxID=2994102 RepID=A0ABT3SNW4_9MYCO|nr:hypothetical protein [Mycobacterium pinniadriaticum]MCX2934779.1 hypothetical protein [Mycobacterium pinniadriaticum]MCX2941222.1 hypothetical protein [Mycobacterium pinniadriaticum]